MMSPVDVHLSKPVEIMESDRNRAVATLTLAFAGDPVGRWAYPAAQQYLTYWPRFIEAFGGRAFSHGTAHALEGCLAVALWLPSGVGPDELAISAVMDESLTGPIRHEVDDLFEQMGRFHPSAAHWYLPLTGVDPMAQGRGLGSGLLRHALAICDRDRLPAYLEATSPRSRDLYERHGFRVLGTIEAGSSPPMWPMLRDPVSP